MSNFDSTTQFAGDPRKSKELTGPNSQSEKPLENLIREALNYDSVCYKQALGLDLG